MRTEDVYGEAGEEAAVGYLEERGFRILDREVCGPDGELTIIAIEGGVLVACMVEARAGTRYGRPLEKPGELTLRRVRGVLAEWRGDHDPVCSGVRIDVIGLLYEGSGGFTIEHIRGAG